MWFVQLWYCWFLLAGLIYWVALLWPWSFVQAQTLCFIRKRAFMGEGSDKYVLLFFSFLWLINGEKEFMLSKTHVVGLMHGCCCLSCVFLHAILKINDSWSWVWNLYEILFFKLQAIGDIMELIVPLVWCLMNITFFLVRVH